MLVEALSLVEMFDCGGDGLTEKSRELILNLLRYSEMPFSRNQFAPGHITCTAVVLHPDRERVLLVHHHRLQRWLLPGGHVEESDAILADAARREAIEETSASVPSAATARLVGGADDLGAVAGAHDERAPDHARAQASAAASNAGSSTVTRA